MKAILRNNLLCVAFLAMAFLAAPQQVSAGDKTYDQCLKDLAKAKDDLAKAEAKAQENKPIESIKKAEDTLYAKARANDDTPGDAAKNPAKKTSEAEEKAAKTAADKIVAKWKDAGAPTDKAEAYRKALEERRDARKLLKKVIDDLNDLARRQKKLSEQDDVKTPLKEARDALKESDQTISANRTATGLGTGESYAALTSTGKIKVTTSGTGETIGHVADLKIQNTTGERISFTVPPMVLESGSGKYQHYACPKAQHVALNPREEKTVPIDGVCLVRGQPPLGKDDKSDLICRDSTPGDHPQDSHLPTKDVNKLLRVAASYYDAAEKLEKKGALKDLPYHDPKTRKEIVTQWGVWSDPEIAKCTGSPAATKEDLKTTIYKQAEKHGAVTPETKKKLDEGIDIIFQDIKLTTKEAKNLEKPDPFKSDQPTGDEGKGGAQTPMPPTGPINVDDGTTKKDQPPKTTDKEKPPTPVTPPDDDECAALLKRVEAADLAYFLRFQSYQARIEEAEQAQQAMADASPDYKKAHEANKGTGKEAPDSTEKGLTQRADTLGRPSYGETHASNDPKLAALREKFELAVRRVASSEKLMLEAKAEFEKLRKEYQAKCGKKYRSRVETKEREEKKQTDAQKKAAEADRKNSAGSSVPSQTGTDKK